MNVKRGPIIFILVLIIVLVFILGLRYGQRVEKTNKAIDYLLSLPPTKPPQPTQIPLEFKEYMHKNCGVKFLYPTSATIEKESSTSALFNQGSVQSIKLTCDLKSALATTEAGLLRRFNPRNGKTITIVVSPLLQPLIEKSLEFLK